MLKRIKKTPTNIYGKELDRIKLNNNVLNAISFNETLPLKFKIFPQTIETCIEGFGGCFIQEKMSVIENRNKGEIERLLLSIINLYELGYGLEDGISLEEIMQDEIGNYRIVDMDSFTNYNLLDFPERNIEIAKSLTQTADLFFRLGYKLPEKKIATHFSDKLKQLKRLLQSN